MVYTDVSNLIIVTGGVTVLAGGLLMLLKGSLQSPAPKPKNGA
jgi:hypothetical protein